MTSQDHDFRIREAVAYFRAHKQLERAIDELLSSGFDRAEISLLATEDTVTKELGHHYHKVTELEDDPAVPRAVYIPKESIGDAQGALIATPLYLAAITAIGAIVVSGGSLLATIVGAAVAGGAGGAFGSGLAKLVGDRYAENLQNQLDHGGLLLWVRTWDEGDEKRAVEILARHSGQDVHVHGTRQG